MRRLILIYLLFLSGLSAWNQTISRIEYFFDSDPGYGSATPLSFTPGSSVTATFDLNTAGLSKGFHNLLIRAKNVNGKWSTVSNYPVFVMEPGPGVPIVKMEYFIDTDPGFGLGTDVAITPGTNVPGFFQLNTDGLADGMHYLCVRVKDAEARWSIFTSTMVVVKKEVADISRLEYFVDTDPGFGAATGLPITAGKKISANFSLNTEAYTPGMHFILVRALDSQGSWSTLASYPFVNVLPLASPDIIAMEYFIDLDPGFGLATAVPVTPGANIDAVFTPSIASLTEGTHLLCLRVKNSAGLWSTIQQYVFSRMPAEKSPVVALEYFTEEDPGYGNGHAVPVTPGMDVTATFTPDTLGLPGGKRLMVRVKDGAGNWSIVHDTTINFSSTPRTWTGAVSDDWNLAGNWSPAGVPGWNDDVLIPSSAPWMPYVRTAGLSCREVVVSAGGELHILPGIVLTINGNFKLE